MRTVMKMRYHKLKENLKKLVKLKQKLGLKKKKKLNLKERKKRKDYLKTKIGRIEQAKRKGETKLREKAIKEYNK